MKTLEKLGKIYSNMLNGRHSMPTAKKKKINTLYILWDILPPTIKIQVAILVMAGETLKLFKSFP